MTGVVWYCYAVARPLSIIGFGDVRGVSDAAVDVVRHNDLVAVVSAVPADEFTESMLRTHLEDLAWLEKVARTHNAVVERVFRRAVTVPFRLATIYLDRTAVERVLADREREFTDVLDRISGHVELGVKVYTNTTPGGEPPDATTDAGRQPGLSYLRRKRSERDAAEAGWRHAVEQSVEVDHDLMALSDAKRLHTVQSFDLPGVGQNVLNVAYLVADNAVERFRRRVEELDQAAGCHIEVTGPWAPYSFALDDSGTGEDPA
jgi:hypothetical protein